MVRGLTGCGLHGYRHVNIAVCFKYFCSFIVFFVCLICLFDVFEYYSLEVRRRGRGRGGGGGGGWLSTTHISTLAMYYIMLTVTMYTMLPTIHINTHTMYCVDYTCTSR